MDGFLLLVGHLVGDYILQEDWQAKNKANQHPPGDRPCSTMLAEGGGWWIKGTPEERHAWDMQVRQWWLGHLACTVHRLLYTGAVWLCSFHWMPLWGLVACFVLHWPVDRFRLASWWMRRMSGQSVFAEKMGPWSIIVVDNTFHLVTLAVIAVLAGRMT